MFWRMFWSRMVPLAFALTALFTVAPLAAEEPLSPAQKDAVREVVRAYLRENPEVLVEAIQALRERQEAEEREQARAAVAAHDKALTEDETSPVAGNPDGNVTVVEFFDYRCGYCKRVFPQLMELMHTDTEVRFVFKELPILGTESVYAARAALAAWHLDSKKYMVFHAALMGVRGALTETKVMDVAEEVGLSVDKLKEAMDEPAVQATIERNIALAKALDITGTPAFVVGGELVPGAVGLDTLRELVNDARKG